jgi:hypothetical protein
MIVGGGTGFSQVFAATTNATSLSQTFGITSGTSNCDSHGTASEARSFIENNREALAKDMSRGQGETLATLSRISGCSDSGAVGETLQAKYRKVFPCEVAIAFTGLVQTLVGAVESKASS